MAAWKSLGEFEHLLLLAVMRLGDEAYGVTIQREIEERTGRPVSLGSIYPTMSRLEERGYVTSVMSQTHELSGWTVSALFQARGSRLGRSRAHARHDRRHVGGPRAEP